jgi:transcriptional regulator with XRE-family HTH domain
MADVVISWMSAESPTLGERIKALRIERGLSMRALAHASGLKSVAFVADLERGFRHPSPDVLAALARALNQPLDSLRRYDLRPPVPELRALTARNPDWALALRKLVDAAQGDRLTPDQLIRLIDKAPRMSAPSKSPPSQTAAVTPPLFGA